MRAPGRWPLAFVGLALCLGAGEAHAQQDPTFTEAFVELRILRGPQEIVDALVADSVMLISVQHFQRLAEVRTLATLPGARLHSTLEPHGVEIVFDTEQRRLLRGDSTWTLDAAHARWYDESLYVSPEVLARAFGLTATLDWADLRLMVRRTEQLPVVRRLERARRRARLLSDQTYLEPRFLPTSRGIADGIILDWAVTSSTRDPLAASSIDAGLGTQVGGGSLDIRYDRRNAPGAGAGTAQASWKRAWPAGSWIRQLHVGDGYTTGRQPRRVRGLSVTNAPFLRASDFATEQLVGTLPDGWEVEFYRGRQLLGFATPDADNRYRFAVPVRYGPNPIQLLSFGPDGQIERSRRTMLVPLERLPGGQFEYGLAAGACTTERCRALLNVDARYGVGSRLTLQIGSDFFWRDSLPDRWHPYAIVAAGPLPSLSVTLEAVANGLVGGHLDFAPTADFEVSVEHVEYTPGVSAPLVGSAFFRRRTQGFLFWRPAARDHSPYFRIMAVRTEAANRVRDRIRLSSTARFSGTHVELGVGRTSEQHDTTVRTSTALDAAATTVLLGPADWMRSTFLRGELALSPDSGLTRAAARVARPLTGGLRVEVETSWRRALGFVIDLTVVTTLPSFRAVSRNSYTAGSGLTGSQLVEGSLLWDRRNRRLGFADGRSVGRAGLTGDVFMDGNGNGRRDPEEAGVANVRLRVGPQAVRTDANGRFTSWDLTPFEPVSLEADTLSLANPLWVPAAHIISVIPDPNGFTVVEFPLVRAGELSGRVLYDDSDRGAAGIRLLLHDRSGKLVREGRTFSDGAFYFHGIRPGTYTLRPEPRVLIQLDAAADSLSLIIDPVNGATAIDDIVIQLRRRASAALDASTRDTTPRMQPDARQPGLSEEDRRREAERRTTDAVRRLIARPINFDIDRFDIRAGADAQLLEAKLAILHANPSLRLQITGHCDARGTHQYNMALGYRRAIAARRFFTARGISDTRIIVRSRGEEEPIDTRDGEAGWSRNRRVEFLIIGGDAVLVLPH